MSGKDMGIPIYFPWTGKKYSHTLGNLWELVSYIWELCGLQLNKSEVKARSMGIEKFSLWYSHSMIFCLSHTLEIFLIT